MTTSGEIRKDFDDWVKQHEKDFDNEDFLKIAMDKMREQREEIVHDEPFQKAAPGLKEK